MQLLIDFWDVKDLIPRDYFLSWSRVLLWLHVAYDLLIALAYYSIPLILVNFIRKPENSPHPWLVVLFNGFIVTCGTLHLLSAVTISIPLYWLDDLLKVFTAILSIATVMLMTWIIPRSLSLPSATLMESETPPTITNVLLQKNIACTQQLMDSALDGIISMDHNGNITAWNAQAEHIFGYSSEQALGREMTALIVPPAYRERCRQGASQYKMTDTSNIIYKRMEITGLRADGSEFPMELTVGTLKQNDSYSFSVSVHDITERKQAQQLLKNKEQMLSESQRIAHIGSWSMNLATDFISWSEEMYRIFGVTPESFEHSLKAFIDLIHPDDRAAMEMWNNDCINGKEPPEIDFRIMLPDGSIRFIRSSGGLQCDKLNNPLRLVGSAQDITERKQMEDELKASEARLRSIIKVSPVPMALYDQQSNTTFLNPAFVQTFGYDADDIPTLADWRLKAYPDQDYRSWVEATWHTTLEKAKQEQVEFPPLELAIRCKNDSIKTVLVTAAEIHHDFTGEHLVILYDITKLKQIEAKLNAIFNASVEGIITIDMSDTIVSANAAVETIFGYKPEQLVGCSISKLMPLSPRYSLVPALQSAGQIQEVEGKHKNGSVVPLDLSIAEFTVDGAHYFTHIVRDISKRKHREQEDKEHLDELAHVTRLGLMGEMASGIAHEINQPLSAIATYAQVSLNLIKAEDPDLVKLSEIIAKTQQQALRAGNIIHRMREFIKPNKTNNSSADINQLIHNAVDLCTADLKQSDIKLTVELEKNLPPIHVDHVQIEQVIINLIRNSIDALKNSSAEKQPHVIIHSQLIPDNAIRVRVKDNGPGLDEDQQQKMVMPFYTTKANGMGMGLSISRSLIEAHKGTLHFNSKLEKGTTFYFTLPLEKTG
jgi:PAS domain S-box-containing protein